MRTLLLILIASSAAWAQTPNFTGQMTLPFGTNQTYPNSADWQPHPFVPWITGPTLAAQLQEQQQNWQRQLAALLNKWQLDDADRIAVYRALRGNFETIQSLALSVLDIHTHPEDIEELVRFINRGSALNADNKTRAESILRDHLFYTEAIQRAALARDAIARNLPPRNLDGPMDRSVFVASNLQLPPKPEPAPIPSSELETSRVALANPQTPKELRDKALAVLLSSRKLLDLIALQTELPMANEEMKKLIALSLAGTKEGADLLFSSVRNKKIPPAIITDAAVVEKLRATGVRDLEERLKSLK